MSLPTYIDLRRLAEQEVLLEGSTPLLQMERLCACLLDVKQTDHVVARFEFNKSQPGLYVMQANIQATLRLQCQRCMEPMDFKAAVSPRFALVTTEQEMESLPLSYEPLWGTEGLVSLLETIEDELLLTLPIVPRHDEICLPMMVVDHIDLPIQAESPFSALAAVKDKLKKDSN